MATLAPWLTHAVGAIRIDSDNGISYDFIASSRTYAVEDATRSAMVLHVASRAELRTNLGVMVAGCCVAGSLRGMANWPCCSRNQQPATDTTGPVPSFEELRLSEDARRRPPPASSSRRNTRGIRDRRTCRRMP